MKKLICCSVLSVAFGLNALAQEGEKQPQLCTADLARSLVTAQVDDSKSVEATDKRIKILLRVAEFLWQKDEPRARKYFSDAFDLALERFKEKGVEEKRSGMLVEKSDDFRFQVVSAVAKKDSKWADKLTETVLKEMEAERGKNAAADKKWADNETNRLLEIASALLDANAATAFQFARRATRFTSSDGMGRWNAFLYKAAKIDQRQADALYAELLVAIEPTASINNLYFIASYPFGYGGNYGVNMSNSNFNVSPEFVPNPVLQRQFLNLLARKTMALQPNQSPSGEADSLPEAVIAASMWRDLEPIVIERLPDMLARVSAAKAYANSVLTAENNAELNSRLKEREQWDASFDKKLEALEKKADTDELDYQIIDLLFDAKTEAEMDKAEDWLSKIEESGVRESATNFLFFKRAELAIKENRLSDAEKWTEKVGELEHRAILAFRLAEAKLKLENDKLRAADVLDAVVKAALKAPNSVERAQVLLGTAFMFEKYDQYRAADILSEAVKTINRLEEPDLSASSIHRKIQGKNFGYFTSYDTPGYNFEKSFEQVSKKDFQGSLTRARELGDRYLRTLATIAVVRDCAENEKNAPQKKPVPKAKPEKKP